MTGYLGSFERKGVYARSIIKHNAEYNPTVTKYYSSSDELVHTEEEWRGKIVAQTISGSTTSGSEQWPNYAYSVTTTPWEVEDAPTVSSGTTSSGVNHVFISYPY